MSGGLFCYSILIEEGIYTFIRSTMWKN